MNNDRRKLIDEAKKLISGAFEQVQHVQDEEQEAYNNLPSHQMADLGAKMFENIMTLNSALSIIANAYAELNKYT